MGEERVIEIATSIVEHNDPLWTAGLLFSLNGPDAGFIQMVLESEIAGKNILDASYLFSKKHLDDLGIVVEEKIYQGDEIYFDVETNEKIKKR